MNRLPVYSVRPPLAALATLLAVAVLIAAACSDSAGSDDAPAVTGDTATTVVTSDGGGGVSPVSAVGPGLSVADALASTLDGPLLVNGFIIVDDGGQVRLCAGLLESFPPQCGAPSLGVQGLDLDGFEGLNSALPVEGGIRTVSWTDQPVQLLGTVSDGVLTVASNVSASGVSSD